MIDNGKSADYVCKDYTELRRDVAKTCGALKVFVASQVRL